MYTPVTIHRTIKMSILIIWKSLDYKNEQVFIRSQTVVEDFIIHHTLNICLDVYKLNKITEGVNF